VVFIDAMMAEEAKRIAEHEAAYRLPVFSKGATEMKRLLATAAIALSITTTAQAANTTVMFASNYWRVTMANANPFCIMQSQISFADGPNGVVNIWWAKGNLSIYVAKTSWQFPSDMQVPFSINLDNGRREIFGVSKKLAPLKFSGINAEIDDGWLDNFAASETMTVTFHDGNEPQWSFNLTDSRDALKSFRSCIKGFAESGAATSPVPQAPSTSPVAEAPKDLQGTANADEFNCGPAAIEHEPLAPKPIVETQITYKREAGSCAFMGRMSGGQPF
jgi:hypothetical protein